MSFAISFFLFSQLGRIATAGTLPEADELSGTWQGSGSWSREDARGKLPTQSELTILLSATGFRFQECWSYPDTDGQPRRPCIEASYERRADSFFREGRKVGDLFPEKLRIFESNSSVSEQILIEKAPDGKLAYRYIYLNSEGASERREAELVRAGSIRQPAVRNSDR